MHQIMLSFHGHTWFCCLSPIWTDWNWLYFLQSFWSSLFSEGNIFLCPVSFFNAARLQQVIKKIKRFGTIAYVALYVFFLHFSISGLKENVIAGLVWNGVGMWGVVELDKMWGVVELDKWHIVMTPVSSDRLSCLLCKSQVLHSEDCTNTK